MLIDIRNALRISGSDLDTEVTDLIEAAFADLGLSGVSFNMADPIDPLIKRAVILYCKAHFGYDDMSEKFMQSYLSLKAHLALSIEYKTSGE